MPENPEIEEKAEMPAADPVLLVHVELEKMIDRRVRKVICKIATDTLMVIGIALCISALLRDY